MIAFTTPLLIVAVAIAMVVLPMPANPVLPILTGCCIVTVGAAEYPSPPSDISIPVSYTHLTLPTSDLV